MERIEAYNYNLVKKDIENIYIIFKDLMREKDNVVLMMGWFQYFILVSIEALNYSGISKKLKYKRAIESCRARLKPLEIEYDAIYQKMEELNLQKMKEYREYVKKEFRIILNGFITNYGIYKTNDKIIGNTFLYESIYKKIIYENNQASKTKIIAVSKEIGEILSDLMGFFELEKEYEGKCRNIHIDYKNYNVFKSNNRLLKRKIDTNNELILLNSLSMINFYIHIICIMNVRKELKYRLGYIIYNNTYKNILKIIEKIDNEEIVKKISKYEILSDRNFRNCMFHYDILHDLEEKEIKDEMYFGIISKYLNTSEKKYIELIDGYMNETSNILENSILN